MNQEVRKKMKGNDGTGNIPERDTWETPQALWDELNKQYKFTFDCCADKKNTKCKSYCTNFAGLVIGCFTIYDKDEKCWMNPPFSKAYDMFEHFFKVVTKGVAIYRCDNMETAIWQDVILKGADWVFIPKGRISYEGKVGKGSRFPSALIGKGVPVPNLTNGIILEVRKRR